MVTPEEAQFEKDKACYEQNFEQFRSLNQTMWQVPVIGMTLTGGLWFGAANVRDMSALRYPLLLLAAFADIGLAVVLTRIRFVMGEYLKEIERFNKESFVGANGTKLLHRSAVVAWTFRILLLLCAVGSISAAGYLCYQGKQPQPVRHVIELLEVPQ